MFRTLRNIFGSSDMVPTDDKPDDENTPVDPEELRRIRLSRFNTPTSQESGNSSPKISSSPSSRPMDIPSARQIAEKSKSSGQSPKSPVKKINWEHNLLCGVFEVTLQPEEAGLSRSYLKYLAKELQEDGQPLELSCFLLDRVMVEQLSYNGPRKGKFMYLMKVLNTLKTEARTARSGRKQLIANVESLVLNYSLLLLERPTLFNLEEDFDGNSPLDELVVCLHERLLPSGYMSEVVSYLEEQRSLQEFVVPIMTLLHTKLVSKSLVNEDLMLFISVFNELMSFKQIGSVVVDTIPGWLANEGANGAQVQAQTYLGTMLGYGCIPNRRQSAVAVLHFQNADTMSRNQLEPIYQSLRGNILAINTNIHAMVKGLITKFREGDRGKEAWLSWVGQALNSNRGYLKTRFDDSLVSDLALLFNTGYVLYLLTEPIINQGTKAVSIMI